MFKCLDCFVRLSIIYWKQICDLHGKLITTVHFFVYYESMCLMKNKKITFVL